jgi:hypothetical protein
MINLQGRSISTENGPAFIIEYDTEKQKFMVEYKNDQAVGWLAEIQFSLDT